MNFKERVKNTGYSQAALAETLGISRSSVQRAVQSPKDYKWVIERFNEEFGENEITHKEKEVNTLKFRNGKIEAIRIVNTNPANSTLDEIVELFDIDVAKWECIAYDVGEWNTPMKIGGKPAEIMNYKVSAKFKPRKNWSLTKEKDYTWLFESLKDYTPAYSNEINLADLDEINNKGEKMLVLPIFDLHFGKLAWEDEVGASYDLKIARKRFLDAIKDLLFRANREGFDKILFPIGSDFFNTDGIGNMTTGGTPQDNDARYKRILRDGIYLLLDAINLCKDYAHTEVCFIPGNHDTYTSFAAYEAVRGWLHNVEGINVSENLKSRKYYEWGTNMIGITHGDKEKGRLFELAQHEKREMWGRTTYMEWLTGHTHHKMVEEKFGVTNRVMSSLSGTDAWHFEKGFVGSLKGAEAIIYHKLQPGPYTIYSYYL